MVIASNAPQQCLKMWEAYHPEGLYRRWQWLQGSDLIELLVHPNGTQAWLCWSREALFPDAVALLLGNFFALLLQLWSVPCLHAAAVAIDGGAVALVGRSGVGKSTTAAALARRGIPVLTEDIAALKVDRAAFWVQPGYPRLRLWPQSVEAMDQSPAALKRVFVERKKRYLDLAASPSNPWPFQTQPLPLRAIYVLGQRRLRLQRPQICPLTPSKALQKLIQRAYWLQGSNQSLRLAQFQQLSQLVQWVPVHQLLQPNDLGCLPQLCDLITADAHASSRRSPPQGLIKDA